jgi:hypothetical protein
MTDRHDTNSVRKLAAVRLFAPNGLLTHFKFAILVHHKKRLEIQ